MKVTYNIPEWGTKTCVLGTEHKEGTYEGRDYKFDVVYGISLKTLPDGRQIVVSESFKCRAGCILPIMIGEPYNIVFDRNGNPAIFKPLSQADKE